MPGRPPGCLAIHGAVACSDEKAAIRPDLAAQRHASEAAIRTRLEWARPAGDLANGNDANLLAGYVANLF